MFEQHLRPPQQAGFAQIVVVQRHQLPDGPLAAPKLPSQRDDDLRGGHGTRDGLEDGAPAAFDALGDGDLALPRQERHGAHFAQVHADGVVRLVNRARRQIEFDFLALLAAQFEQLLIAVLSLGIDDLDAGVAQHTEQVVELFGGGQLGGEHIVHLLVEQESLLLAEGDELANLVVLCFD